MRYAVIAPMTDAGDLHRGILAYPANVNSDGNAHGLPEKLAIPTETRRSVAKPAAPGDTWLLRYCPCSSMSRSFRSQSCHNCRAPSSTTSPPRLECQKL